MSGCFLLPVGPCALGYAWVPWPLLLGQRTSPWTQTGAFALWGH